MKKVLLGLFLLVFLCFPIKSNDVVTNSFYSIKVNLFYENNCKKCEEAKKWLEGYKKENYINVEYININENKNLYNDIKKF